MNQKKVYKNYPLEFKEAAVLVTEQGYSVSEAAESLGNDFVIAHIFTLLCYY